MNPKIPLPELDACYQKLKRTFATLTADEARSLLAPGAVRY